MAKVKMIVTISVPDNKVEEVAKLLEWDGIWRGELLMGGSHLADDGRIEVEKVEVIK